MNVVVIDNYDSFVHNLVRYVRESINGKVQVFRNDAIDFKVLKEADGILISPGPGIPKEAGDLFTVLSEFIEHKPILGVCLGHQAIAEHLGGTLTQLEVPIHGKASEINQNQQSKLFEGLPEQLMVGRYHSWSVYEKLPPSLRPIAFCAEGNIMALEHTKLPVYGVQFHPESILTEHGRTIIQNWINTL